jgi:hypothetical protein
MYHLFHTCGKTSPGINKQHEVNMSVGLKRIAQILVCFSSALWTTRCEILGSQEAQGEMGLIVKEKIY